MDFDPDGLAGSLTTGLVRTLTTSYEDRLGSSWLAGTLPICWANVRVPGAVQPVRKQFSVPRGWMMRVRSDDWADWIVDRLALIGFMLDGLAATRWRHTDSDLCHLLVQEFGFVRKCVLTNLSNDDVAIRILDGMQNILPGVVGSIYAK